MAVPFNRPFTTGKEFEYIQQAIASGVLSGNGQFTRRCQTWLEQQIRCKKALLTHSCTAALEMAAILTDIQPGDEVLMPSYTFVSTANAFVLRGGVPVFVDIRPDTLNIDETKIETAITSRTKAIVPVHYAGVGCDMDSIMDIARRHDLWVIEDAAQGLMSTYKGEPLGSFGHLAATSFHETKNIICGEGGALLISDDRLCDRAEIIWEKGTNRSQFFQGKVDKYTWVDIGSSYLPSEVNAAFLWAQIEEAENITQRRLSLWKGYNEKLEILEAHNNLRRPVIPRECAHNAHMYYILLPDSHIRQSLITYFQCNDINAVFHYVPLHSSPAGLQYGRSSGNLFQTDDLSNRLLRLPLWVGMDEERINLVLKAIFKYISLSSS